MAKAAPRFKYIQLALLLAVIPGILSAQRVINIDAKKVKGERSHMFNECIGAGRAEEGLRADWQRQLTEIQSVMHFNYIRFHGLLNDDMHIYTEDAGGGAVYNWQYLDKLYDFLLSVHIKPFVEISFMPPALASGQKTVFWYKGNVTPPKSYDKWAALITAMVKHWQERYGFNEVKSWYFEVWNEPDLAGFFAGKQQDYFKLYEVTAKAIKSLSGQYRVGGPATARIAWIKPFLAFCSDNKVPLDFVSTHSYNTKSVFDEFGKSKRKLMPADYLYHNVGYVRRVIDSTQYKDLPLHYTEFNSSPSSHDPIHDTYQNAAYILNTLHHTEGVAQSMSYWTFTDIFEEAGPALTPFHGGFGLLNLQAIKKPTYFAYLFLSEQGNQELVNTDTSAVITKNKKGYQLLLWNLKFPVGENIYDEDYFKNELPARPDKTVNINVKNMQNGRYRVEIYQTGYLQNDAFSAYCQMGSPFYVTREQEALLKSKSSGKSVKTITVSVKKNGYSLQLPERENDVYFVKLLKL
jgi:xylan 1,4-beta-xylosidase